MISLQSVNLGYSATPILHDLDLRVGNGEFLGVIGLSGAGKSTLLMSMIGNIQVLKGQYQVFGYDLSTISKQELRHLRSRVGFIFQGYNLVNRLSVLHNVMSGMLKDIPVARALIKLYSREELDKAYEYMQVVGIDQLAMKRCDELSGGQRQRVAIARALAQEPKVLLADEPVAALDPKSAVQVMDVLRKVNETYGVTIVSNLHHLDFARKYCGRIVGIAEGSIAFDGVVSALKEEALNQIYQGNSVSVREDAIDQIMAKIHDSAKTLSAEGNNSKSVPVAA